MNQKQLNSLFMYFIYMFQDKSKDSKANPLSVKNIGGVFVVLLAGLLASIIVAVLEFCWNSRKVLILKNYFISYLFNEIKNYFINELSIYQFNFAWYRIGKWVFVTIKSSMNVNGASFLVIEKLISQQNADEVFSLQMNQTSKQFILAQSR